MSQLSQPAVTSVPGPFKALLHLQQHTTGEETKHGGGRHSTLFGFDGQVGAGIIHLALGCLEPQIQCFPCPPHAQYHVCKDTQKSL